ncbi:cytochrome P450 315a1, mitochondrial [Dermatophagoides farinae]|uniref:cytochrome P450 315a1, mitochondrial n=1 Tax=Dermatophagoides farinae TaxID=6954 RepID=UPI003F5E4063
MHSQRSSTILFVKKFINEQLSSSSSSLLLLANIRSNCWTKTIQQQSQRKFAHFPKQQQTRYNLVNKKNKIIDIQRHNKRTIMIQSTINRQQATAAMDTTTTTTTMTQSDQIRCPFHHHDNIDHNHHHHHHHYNQLKNGQQQYQSFEQIPTPAGLPLIGTLYDLIRAGGAEYVHQYCDKRHEQLGPIYREKLGNVEAVFIADANLVQQVYKHEGKYPQHMVPEPWIIYNQNKGIKRGLFFMEGEEWSIRRSALNKVFLKPDIINDYTEVFNQVVTDILDKWSMKMVENHVDSLLIDGLEKELYNWSIESLGTMIFGRRLGCITPQPSSALPDIHEFVNCVQRIFIESSNMQLIPPKLAHYFRLPVWRRFEDAASKALDLAFQYVNENARQINNNDDESSMNNQGIIKQLMNDGHMQLDEISRIIVDLFIAAADTTSHATQWALYLLSRHPNVQERLCDEIEQVTGGESINVKHLQNLSYVKGIIKESLRLYPVAPFLTRYLSDDLILGGYHVPKGQLVVISLFTTGRKNEYFDEPEKFQPERWLRDRQNGRNRVANSHACLPFGLGVRSCIGRRVAEIQMQFFLSRLVQRFHIRPTSDKEIDIKLRMITTPEKSIDLILKHR